MSKTRRPYPESQPIQVADGSRANPANDLPDATAQQPQRPAPRYKSAVQLPCSTGWEDTRPGR